MLDSDNKIVFYPKFNWIEMLWGSTKRYTRRNCTYSFKDLEGMLPKVLKTTSLFTIRRFAQMSYNYISEYRSGHVLTPQQIEHGIRRFGIHPTDPFHSRFLIRYNHFSNKISTKNGECKNLRTFFSQELNFQSLCKDQGPPYRPNQLRQVCHEIDARIRT